VPEIESYIKVQTSKNTIGVKTGFMIIICMQYSTGTDIPFGVVPYYTKPCHTVDIKIIEVKITKRKIFDLNLRLNVCMPMPRKEMH
jgi:hypothetical protein